MSRHATTTRAALWSGMLALCAGCMGQVTVVEDGGCDYRELPLLDPVDEVYCGCAEYGVGELAQDTILLLDTDAVEHDPGDQVRITKHAPHYRLTLTDESMVPLFVFEAQQTGSVDFVFDEGWAPR